MCPPHCWKWPPCVSGVLKAKTIQPPHFKPGVWACVSSCADAEHPTHSSRALGWASGGTTAQSGVGTFTDPTNWGAWASVTVPYQGNEPWLTSLFTGNVGNRSQVSQILGLCWTALEVTPAWGMVACQGHFIPDGGMSRKLNLQSAVEEAAPLCLPFPSCKMGTWATNFCWWRALTYVPAKCWMKGRRIKPERDRPSPEVLSNPPGSARICRQLSDVDRDGPGDKMPWP